MGDRAWEKLIRENRNLRAKLAAAEAEPHLGCATTRELLNELEARIELDYYAGGGGLGYTTAHGRPASLTKEGGNG